MRFFDGLIASLTLPPAFGLDISDYSVKFVKMIRRSSDEPDIVAFGEAGLPEGVVVSGEIKRESELSNFLKNNLVVKGEKHFTDTYVVATLPEEKSFVHLIQLPKMKPEDAGKAARWELEGIVPIPIEDLYFDYGILPPAEESSDHLDLLVTAFPKEVVDSYVRVLTEAGFIPVALELEAQAISRALWNGENASFIFVDLGRTRTSTMIMAASSLIFTLSIPIGGRDFDKAISQRLGVSEEEARKIKIESGLSKDYKNGALYEALIPLVSALADELKKQILFYREHSARQHGMPADISGIILSGGDANLRGLVNHLSIILKKEIKIGNPLSSLLRRKGFQPPFSKNDSLKYTTAIGSALRGVGL